MPQLNKGGKFVFGLSVVRDDLTIHIPPQALSEYNATQDGKCGSKTRLQIREDTELKNFPLNCPKCKQEALVAVKNFQMIVLNNQTAMKGGG